jgi:drug/metabolite transporter (DMT)-like permease
MFSLAGFCETRLSRRTAPVTATLVVLLVGLVAIAPIAFAVEGIPERSELDSVARAAVAGVLYAGAMGCFIIGVGRGDLSVVAPLAALEGGFAAVIAVALGERLGGLTAAGLVLAVIGAVLSAVGPSGGGARGAIWGILAALFFGPTFILYGDAQELSSFVIVFVSRFVSVAIAAFFFVWNPDRSIDRPSRRFAVAAGLFDVAGFLALTYAVAHGPVSVASVLVAQFATFAVLIGLIVLRERPAWHQLAGVACVIGGVSVIAAAS